MNAQKRDNFKVIAHTEIGQKIITRTEKKYVEEVVELFKTLPRISFVEVVEFS